MTRYLRLIAGLIGLLVVVAASAVFIGKDVAAQQSFFDPCGSATVQTLTANSASDIKGNFGVGIGADCVPLTGDDSPNYNSGGLIYFTPPEWEVAVDADIPDGAKIGTFGSRAVLGILDNGCSTVLGVPFDLVDGTIDHAKPIVANAPGTPDRLKNIAADSDGNSIADGAEKWPTYLDAVAERAGIDMSKLIARFVGFNSRSVSGTTVVLNFLIFEPGTKVSNLINLDPRMGYPAVTVLQDPSTIASAADPVSDFCAPLYTETTLFGEVGGKTFRGNPGNGAYNFVTFVASAPDFDGDGIENGLDPCNLVPNTSGWDPRAVPSPIGSPSPGDNDSDGIPNDCDPFPDAPSLCTPLSGISQHDEDCDTWQNRGDNCAIDANPLQEDADNDGMGDVCDPDDVVRTNVTFKCLISPQQIGTGGTAPDVSNLQPCGTAPIDDGTGAGTPTPIGQTPAPTPTVCPTCTPRPSGAAGQSGIGQGPAGGVGSLSPTGFDLPVWAAIFTAVGAIGAIGGFTLMGSRLRRRR